MTGLERASIARAVGRRARKSVSESRTEREALEKRAKPVRAERGSEFEPRMTTGVKWFVVLDLVL